MANERSSATSATAPSLEQASAPTVYEDAVAFNSDPDCADEIIYRLKQHLREKFNLDDDMQILIGPSFTPHRVNMQVKVDGQLVMWNEVDLSPRFDLSGEEELEHGDDDLFHREQDYGGGRTYERTILSTEPKFLVKKLFCDGGCGCRFSLDDVVYTSGALDYSEECFSKLPAQDKGGFTLVSVRRRVTEHAETRAAEAISALGCFLGETRPAFAPPDAPVVF